MAQLDHLPCKLSWLCTKLDTVDYINYFIMFTFLWTTSKNRTNFPIFSQDISIVKVLDCHNDRYR